MTSPTCKCGNKELEYMVGNGGLEGWYCYCGTAALTDDGKVVKWFEPIRKPKNV